MIKIEKNSFEDLEVKTIFQRISLYFKSIFNKTSDEPYLTPSEKFFNDNSKSFDQLKKNLKEDTKNNRYTGSINSNLTYYQVQPNFFSGNWNNVSECKYTGRNNDKL